MGRKEGLAKDTDRRHAARGTPARTGRSSGTARGKAPQPDLLDQRGPTSDEDVSVPASGR